MMEVMFLLCWTAIFVGAVFWVTRKVVSRNRIYLLILVNLFFLAGVFYLFPLWVVGL